MKKYIAIFALVLCACSYPPTAPMVKAMDAPLDVVVMQSDPINGTSGVKRLYTRVHLPTVNTGQDSVLLFSLPANVELRYMSVHCDTIISPGGTDSIKIGISGEDIPVGDSYRFASIWNDSLQAGESVVVSHLTNRSNVAGQLYTYDGTVDVVCSDAETYYPITGLMRFPFGVLDTSGSGSALIVPKYCDGWYSAQFNISFSASSATTAHAEISLNGAGYDYIAIERTIGTGSSIGAASASGGIYLAAGDSVGIFIESDSPSKTFTINHCQLTLEKYTNGVPYRTGATGKDVYLYTGSQVGTFRFYLEYVEIYP